MCVFAVFCNHHAEGSQIVAIFDHEPTPDDLTACRERSMYSASEWDKWCNLSVERMELNRPYTFAELDGQS